MGFVKQTLEKIENSNSIEELEKIKAVINTPSIGWSYSEKVILNNRIKDAMYVVAATLAASAIREAKKSMIENGIADEQVIFATCNLLAEILDLPVSLVVDLMETL